jgi:hypothetical protein
MSVILNFSKWKKLFEQAEPASSTSIDFVIMAGASTQPVSDQALVDAQKYPKPSDTSSKNHIYEISLAAAMAGNFSKARIAEEAVKGSVDLIEFDGKSISESGKLTIDWNKNNFSKIVRVSGNGALVLARAADKLSKKKGRTELTGVIILELASASLYSTEWSILGSGLSPEKIGQSLNGILSQVATQLMDAAHKPAMVEKWTNNLDLIEKRYSPAILQSSDSGQLQKSIPPLPENTALRSFYGKYQPTTLKVDLAKISQIVKTTIVDAGLDALTQHADKFFSEKLKELDPSYIQQLTSKIKENINSVKNNYNGKVISEKIKSAIESIPSTIIAPSTVKAASDTTIYNVGKSSA